MRHYLDILAATYMVRILQPWHENLCKRQVKAPKIYLADSGILHSLLDIGAGAEALLGHPRVGASWEGFVLHQIVRTVDLDWQDCHHWRLHTGAELDLLTVKGDRRLGFEIKRTDAPRVTPSMRSALDALGLDRLFVVHAGRDSWPLAAAQPRPGKSLRWMDWTRYSAPQKQAMPFGGLLGDLTYRGDLTPFAPWLRLGEALGVGGKTTFGLGAYRLDVS